MKQLQFLIYISVSTDLLKAYTIHQAFAQQGIATFLVNNTKHDNSTENILALIKKHKVTHILMLENSAIHSFSAEYPDFFGHLVSIPIFILWNTFVTPYLVYLQFLDKTKYYFLTWSSKVKKELKLNQFNVWLCTPFYDAYIFTPGTNLTKHRKLGCVTNIKDTYALSLRQMWSFEMHNIANDIVQEIIKAFPNEVDINEALKQKIPTADVPSFIGLTSSMILQYLYFFQENLKKEKIFSNKIIFNETTILGNVKSHLLANKIKTIDITLDNLKKFYNETAINFVFPSLTENINTNILDILGSQNLGFHWQTNDLENFFEINKDLIVFKSVEELIEKATFYLNNLKEFNFLRKKGYNAVINNYTPAKFAQTIKKLIV